LRVTTKFLFLILILFSCQEQRNKNKRIKFYYPNQSEFNKSAEYELVDVKTFKNFDVLIDSVENIKYKSKRIYINVQNDNTEYNILASTFFGQDYPPIIKFKNILKISSDSISKNVKYPIDSLKNVLKRDLENFGKNNRLSDSPKKLIVSVTTDIGKLESLLTKICKTFNEIKTESTDTLLLNLQLNRRLEIVPPPP
jgi:methyl-accepting chemotaxis protein